MRDLADLIWKWRCKVIGNKEDFKHPAAGSPSEDLDHGTDAVIKTLYEGKGSVDNYYNWVDYPPRQLSKSAAKAQDRVAIKVYKIKDKEKPVIHGHSVLKFHMVDIQSTVLISALKCILEKEDVYLEPTETATFKEPFRALYFRSDEIADLSNVTKDATTLKTHLELLLRVMGHMFGDTKAHVKRLQANGLVAFRLAWTYFPKDCIVYSWESNCEFLGKVVSADYQMVATRLCLVVTCKLMEFNGEQYIWEEKTLVIPQFVGNTRITDMPCYPLQFHENPERIKSAMMARARKALDFQGLTYCTYTGIALYQMKEKHNVDGRILVDTIGYNKFCLAKGNRESQDPEVQKNKVLGDVDVPEKSSPSSQPNHLPQAAQEANKKRVLETSENLLFMSPFVKGFALKNKEWRKSVERYLHPRSLTDRSSIGEGLTILLSGPPGTGKTLTAEAVADRTRRPLFYLQAEDLGIAANELGTNLKKAFEMATGWGAVVLLDEADVFMAQRNPNDIVRNELVSIFLRELEYYRGIIFLTTNLFDTIDSAFRSRIQLHLVFNPLSPTARLAVWRKFLQRLPPMAPRPGDEGIRSAMKDLDEEHLSELAMWHLNGREIKNAVNMVKAWCDIKGYDMTLSRIESAIKATAPNCLKRDHTAPVDLYD
ncbi:predicted protein [Uncinocarpus reesii 1704]|uniref:AAA+ ATPase domain-containing protein n=1 Tax=Uncinocarpus reesii (strain UAMH 1704) TaxID=336963 RepID=C4JL69_UNCRE|nr:uncharacterized protein UREG_00404 [Uncinocarpus reesii 1704]EEP75558.1 predicted protein [Uncinocarpus reesii 1704]